MRVSSLILLVGTSLWLSACTAPKPGSSPERALAAKKGSHSAVFKQPAFKVIPETDLSKKYDTVYFISDIHGMLEEMMDLLTANGIISEKSTKNQFILDPSFKRSILVIAGDSINKGKESVRVLQRIEEMITLAPKNQSLVIAVLGNHETDLLADPKENCPKEFLESAQGIEGIQKGEKLSCKDIIESSIGDTMRTFPVAAVLGRWLVAHSGYLDSKSLGDDPAEKDAAAHGEKFFKKISEMYEEGDYYELNKPANSIIATHDWFKKYHKSTGAVLKAMGLTAMLVGHEPGLLNSPGEIAFFKEGWFAKLDAGMNAVAGDSKGMLLKCGTKDILSADNLLNGAGEPICTQYNHKGKASEVPLKAPKE